MTYEKMTSILDELKIKYAYFQFEPGELDDEDKYIAYFEVGKQKFLADDKVYHYEPHFAVELYTRVKDIETEEAFISLLAENDIPWDGGETVFIDSEQMFLTTFYV